MKEPEEIRVINKSYKSELKEKGSRFIAFAFPVNNEEEIISNLEQLKKEFYDASHHCYAYKLIDSFKYSDAGEPSGTAGIRIYNAVEHFNLVNIFVVVVRYFGGTKLGVGNLGRAYYDSSIDVLSKAYIKTKHLYQKIFIKIDFHLAQKIYHLFGSTDNKIINVKYSEHANFECLVRPDDLNQYFVEINNLSGGKAEITVSEVYYY